MCGFGEEGDEGIWGWKLGWGWGIGYSDGDDDVVVVVVWEGRRLRERRKGPW